MTLSGLDIVTRSAAFEDRAASCELRGWQWTLLHALDDQTEMRDLAKAHGLDLDQALAFCAEAEGAGLVCVATMTLDQYRRAAGLLAPAMSADDDQTAADHLALERTVPAWMIAHDDETSVPPLPIADDHAHDHAHVAEHDDAYGHAEPEPAHVHQDAYDQVPEESAPASEPAYAWQHEAEAPVAEQYHDAAAPAEEHHDAPEQSHEPVYEWHENGVVAHHDEAPAPEEAAPAWHPESFSVAEAHHHDAAADEHAWQAASDELPAENHEAHAENHEALAENHEALAEHHDAANAVAELVSFDQYQEHAAPDHKDVAAHSDEQPGFTAMLHDESGVDVATGNGHVESAQEHVPSWQPMQLVTSVDAPRVSDPIDPSVPLGIDIRLGEDPNFDAGDPFVETPPKGSIAFSFSPGETPAFESTVTKAQAPPQPPPPEARDQSQTVQPSAPAVASPAPAYENGAYGDDAGKPKNDLVGNLLAKALTFRIK